MPEVRVQPRSVYEHHINIDNPQTTIHWTFSTKKNTICFGLYYKPRPQRVSMDNIKSERHSISTSIKSSRRKSSSAISVNLLDKDFIELIPIDQADSKDKTVTGSYLAQEPGNYVLIFDNMFSRNTSKSLTFQVALNDNEDEGLYLNRDEMSGWLLKKRRKRMQGWAKRWFELSSTGVLSYSVRKGDSKRGSVQILLATISISPKQRTMHLDSGTTTFHLKAMSNQSFDDWMNQIRAKRNTNVNWQEDVNDTRSAISIPVEKPNDILQALKEMDQELAAMKTLVYHLSTEQSVPTTPTTETLPTSPSSLKLRFPFKRVSSSSSSNHTTTADKFLMSLQHLSDLKDKISISYSMEQQMTTRKSPSFFSYSAQSDQFFDAADDFVLSNEENESMHDEGSIVIDSEDEEQGDSSTASTFSSKNTIERRNKLPHPVAVQSISVLGILRQNIGKDLATISLPVTLNEPINILQRLCEELEYTELLDKACTQPTCMDKLMYITAFAISGYASTQHRIGRKPFNPLLTETYECIRPDKGFKFISEKVSHHPNIMACCAESKNYTYHQTYYGKTKFWGKSLELVTEGQTTIEMGQDTFSYTRPSSWLRNLMTGTKYLENIGEMKVMNHTTGEYAVVTFKETTETSSFFSSGAAVDRNNVTAKFYSADNQIKREAQGKWSECFSQVLGVDRYAVLWRHKPPHISNYQDYYGLTQFAMELNEVTSLERSKLPITDTRYRPDQVLFEKGQVAEAEVEKVRVEQMQRERNKTQEMKPLWFEAQPSEHSTMGQEYRYKGGYWEARNSGQWPKEMLQLW